MSAPARDVLVDAPALAAVLLEWRAEGGAPYLTFGPADARRFADVIAGRVAAVSLDIADRMLLAIGWQDRLAEIAPPPGKPPRAWSKPHPARKLTAAQVRAAHVIYEQRGLSLRQLGALLWERYGYASPQSCANALHDLFRAQGLPRRDRIAATIAANTVHGRGARNDRAAYKRWHRRTHGRWPSDLRTPSERAKCCAENARGERCGNFARGGSVRCAVHDGLAHAARWKAAA